MRPGDVSTRIRRPFPGLLLRLPLVGLLDVFDGLGLRPLPVARAFGLAWRRGPAPLPLPRLFVGLVELLRVGGRSWSSRDSMASASRPMSSIARLCALATAC